MIYTEEDWNEFWNFVEHTKNHEMAAPPRGRISVTFNTKTGKVEFSHVITGRKGELPKEDFKRLFGKHTDLLLPYFRGDKELPEDPSDDVYVAFIIRYYNKWIAHP